MSGHYEYGGSIVEMEWENELPHFEWFDKDMHCIIHRNPRMKNLNGYVGVKPNHPLHRVSHIDDYSKTDSLQCHGGITYSEEGPHIEGMLKGYWYFGFDTAHSFDYVPGLIEIANKVSERFPMIPLPIEDEKVYRNFEYVMDEVKQLAKQLKEIK